MHDDERFVAEYDPGPHGEHDVASPLLKVPAGQLCGTDDVDAAIMPGEVAEQFALPYPTA